MARRRTKGAPPPGGEPAGPAGCGDPGAPPPPPGVCSPWPLVGAAVVATLIRFLYLRSMWAAFPHTHDTMEGFDAHTYRLWAERVASGDWLGRSQGAFYYAPLYPTLLGLVLALCGGPTVVVALVLNAATGVAGAVCAAGASMRRFGIPAGWGAGILFALSGTQVAWEGLVLGDALLATLTMAALWIMPDGRKGTRRWFACGCLCALLVAGRASFLVPVGCIALWVVWRRDGRGDAFRSLAAFVFPVLLLSGGLVVRNGLLGGVWAITTNGPVNFYLGNVPGSPGVFSPPEGFEELQARINKLPVGARGAAWRGELLARAAEDPVAVLGGFLRKTELFLSSWDAADNTSYYFLRAHLAPLRFTIGPLVVVTAGWLGLVLLWGRWGRIAPCLIFGVGFAASIIAVFVAGRYKLPFTGMHCVFAGGGLGILLAEPPARRLPLLKRLVLALPFALLLAWPRPQPPDSYRNLLRPNEYLHATLALVRVERFAEAADLAGEGADLFPGIVRLREIAAFAEASRGNWDGALRQARLASQFGHSSELLEALQAEARPSGDTTATD